MDSIRHLEYKFSTVTYELIKACNDYELRFYAWIKLWAINKDSAWPGSATICNELGWSREKFFKAIKAMEMKERLIVTRNPGKNNVYDISWYDRANGAGDKRVDNYVDKYVDNSQLVRKPNTPSNRSDQSGNRTLTNNTTNIYNNRAKEKPAKMTDESSSNPKYREFCMETKNKGISFIDWLKKHS